ncbi:hypothetical protein BMS3Abin05_00840 [bacterium BMS3Abin05]|nr:hypothetical protein BMS3Abin05_00840 [bacterium BMS3Abin05]GBE28266.1 hypothetical protein BMS3Bbin03_02205 [bacterium BMS3Bbin03]
MAATIEICKDTFIHKDAVEKLKRITPSEETLYSLSELFKVFGDTTRIKILFMLFVSEVCVCDIAAFLNMSQSAISHQLRILKQMRLVRFRRQGKTVFYSLDDNHIKRIFDQGLEHILERSRGERSNG